MTEPTVPTVTFDITKFHKIGGKHRYCDYSMSLAGGGSVVTLDPSTNTLTVSSKSPVQIVFTATGAYLLAGICFRETGSGKSDPNGTCTFPNVVLNLAGSSSTLTLTDTADTSSSYEFAMLVVGINEEALGLIDPPIVNRPPA
ncbi:hypothetical protein [Arenimonas donghaensis]|uniref:Uncharacterized protein n=1 Tax=Arenimonas donghaensis DSM 18148 = HO3-R19 TaxID=1121014 RepID=A0A087MLW2_9GAMM|nr:hypothetical protein [Arenimonas donghaensis]KFL37865.1 hypothetical protein N788_01470 [Arenimonas donghaensis DSM 18148 = HO3-R19]